MVQCVQGAVPQANKDPGGAARRAVLEGAKGLGTVFCCCGPLSWREQGSAEPVPEGDSDCHKPVEKPAYPTAIQANFDECKDMARTMGVRVLPTFHIYRGAEGRVAAFSATISKLQLFKVGPCAAWLPTERAVGCWCATAVNGATARVCIASNSGLLEVNSLATRQTPARQHRPHSAHLDTATHSTMSGLKLPGWLQWPRKTAEAGQPAAGAAAPTTSAPAAATAVAAH